MSLSISFGGGLLMRGPLPSEDFSYSVAETPLSILAKNVDVSFHDATNTNVSSAGVVNNASINVTDSPAFPGHSISSNSPTVATVDAFGNVSFVSADMAQIDISTPVGHRRLNRAMTTTVTNSTIWKSYKAGSVGEHVLAAIATMISGKTPGIGTQQFTPINNFDVAAPSVTRNASIFTGTLDLTSISVMRKDTSLTVLQAFPVTLISPRHVIAAAHILGGMGTVVWKASNGTYKTANIISIASDVTNDVGVGYLSAPIVGIAPMKFLPANWANYLGSLLDFDTSTVQHLPCLSKTFHMDDTDTYTSGVSVLEVQLLPVILPSSVSILSGPAIKGASYKSWTDGVTLGVRGGDSGGPIMLPINGSPVLLSNFYTAGGGPNLVGFSSWIESQMNSLAAVQADATVYSMLRADLSGFTAYPTI